MKNLDVIAEELFNKIRGRFPTVTIGTDAGEVTNKPNEARYFDFDFKEGPNTLGKVSISLDEDNIAVMYSNDFVTTEDQITKDSWYNFLKELRVFAKKRLLNFDTRDITKSNLNKRDYKFLAQNRSGELTMESKMYGTSRTSYQNVGTARVAIKHTAPINQESTASRSTQVGSIYIESNEGERFKYPFKHLNGARAMAMHVSEGGKPFDDFGKHITSLSEELNKLKKFKTYMGRSSVMAESLAGYMDVVRERISTVKKTIESLQKPTHYKQAFESFETPVLEDVPADVAENWIDQLTIKQFNEELKDVFPYIYNLVSEATKAKELGPEDLLGEGKECNCGPDCACGGNCGPDCNCGPNCGVVSEAGPVDDLELGQPAETYKVKPGDTLYSIYKKFKDANFQGHDYDTAEKDILDMNPEIEDPAMIQPGMVIKMPYFMGTGPDGAGRGLPPGGFQKYESEIDSDFEEMLGQFSDKVSEADAGDFEAKFRAIQKRGGAVAVSIHGLLKDSGLDADQIMGFDPNIPSNRTKANQFQQGRQEEVLQKAQQALGGQAQTGGRAQPSASGQDLGDGFSLVKVDAFGQKDMPAVLDTQSNQYIIPNKSFIRSPAPYIIVKNGKPSPAMKLGPATTKAMQAAGLMKLNFRKEAMEEGKAEIPLGEFILSYFDKETGQFPKGETAVLTMVEKDYGEQYIPHAKKFIEQVGSKFHEIKEKEAADYAGVNDSSELDRMQKLAGLKEYGDEDEMMSSSEFPKIRTDIKKNINGQPHIGIEYANGDMWIVPQASDGKPVFTHKSIQSNDLLKRQLRAKGVGFPLKYDGDYDKREGKWMNQEDVWDYENNAKANSPYAKAQEKNIADLKAAGIDIEKELEKARNGQLPDKRIKDEDDLIGYWMQKKGIKDNTPDQYQLSGFGHDMDDDGYDFKDTSKFIKGGAKKASPKFGKDTPNLSGFDAVDALAKQGRANVDALAKSGMDAVSRLRKNAGIGSRSTGPTIDSGATGPTID